MTHEFVNYSEAEQKEFLSISEKMDWKQEEGDFYWNGKIVEVITEDMINDDITGGFKHDWTLPGRTWLPQAHDLLEMLRTYKPEILLASEFSVNGDWEAWQVYEDHSGEDGLTDHWGLGFNSPHLCLALARAVKQ